MLRSDVHTIRTDMNGRASTRPNGVLDKRCRPVMVTLSVRVNIAMHPFWRDFDVPDSTIWPWKGFQSGRVVVTSSDESMPTDMNGPASTRQNRVLDKHCRVVGPCEHRHAQWDILTWRWRSVWCELDRKRIFGRGATGENGIEVVRRDHARRR